MESLYPTLLCAVVCVLCPDLAFETDPNNPSQVYSTKLKSVAMLQIACCFVYFTRPEWFWMPFLPVLVGSAVTFFRRQRARILGHQLMVAFLLVLMHARLGEWYPFHLWHGVPVLYLNSMMICVVIQLFGSIRRDGFPVLFFAASFMTLMPMLLFPSKEIQRWVGKIILWDHGVVNQLWMAMALLASSQWIFQLIRKYKQTRAKHVI